MIIVGIDPARAPPPPPHHRQRLAVVGRDFQCGEKSRHDRRSSTSRRGTALWDLYNDVEIRAPGATLHFVNGFPDFARATRSSTLGRMWATMTSTPAPVGCRPSG